MDWNGTLGQSLGDSFAKAKAQNQQQGTQRSFANMLNATSEQKDKPKESLWASIARKIKGEE